MCSPFPSRSQTGVHSWLLPTVISTFLVRSLTSLLLVVLGRKLPSSFKSTIGKIIHKLKAELKQSMKLTKKAKVHFSFVSKPDMEIPGIMVIQINKSINKLFYCRIYFLIWLNRNGQSDFLWTRSYRNLCMAARTNLSGCLALEIFLWMFTLREWASCKVGTTWFLLSVLFWGKLKETYLNFIKSKMLNAFR